jgi:hypothetical protein
MYVIQIPTIHLSTKNLKFKALSRHQNAVQPSSSADDSFLHAVLCHLQPSYSLQYLTIMWQDLPEDLCRNVAFFLSPPEILTCLMINRSWNHLGQLPCFWKDLEHRDTGKNLHLEGSDAIQATARTIKLRFLEHAYASRLKVIEWRPISAQDSRSPSSREGHLMCVLGNSGKIVLTGGFCDDEMVYVLSVAAIPGRKRWTPITPQGQRPTYVYGASLTALHDTRAVRFGGFRAGGYSNECNHVFVLTIQDDKDGIMSCSWQMIATRGPQPVGRAYHSATLLLNRYLFIVGGMGTTQSLLEEAILDTQTWTWLDGPISYSPTGGKPSARHGHSLVVDEVRNRLVIFGGGSGSDLLRSGADNTEVWELQLSDGWEADLESSLPWAWNQIHEDEDNDEADSPNLALAESLCLGRCHVGVKVARGMVLLAFGSGHPCTNGVIGYDLESDEFVRPVVKGPLPIPRFTAAAALVDHSWLLVHGGFSIQENGSLGDTVLLDLAPDMTRSFPFLETSLSRQPFGVRSYRPIRDSDVQRRRGEYSTGLMLTELMMAAPEERRAMASQFLQRLIRSGQLGTRAAVLMSLVANDNAVLAEASDEDGDDGDDGDGDEDYVEEG